MESVLKTESTSNSLAISSGRSVDEDFPKGKNRNATLEIHLVWFDMKARPFQNINRYFDTYQGYLKLLLL